VGPRTLDLDLLLIEVGSSRASANRAASPIAACVRADAFADVAPPAVDPGRRAHIFADPAARDTSDRRAGGWLREMRLFATRHRGVDGTSAPPHARARFSAFRDER
jgi:hypothetical protein